MPFDPFFKAGAKWDYAHFLTKEERVEFDKLIALPHHQRVAYRCQLRDSQQRYGRIDRAFIQAMKRIDYEVQGGKWLGRKFKYTHPRGYAHAIRG